MAGAGEGDAREEEEGTGSGLLAVRSRLAALRDELLLAKLSAAVRIRELARALTVEEVVSGAADEAVRAEATEAEEEDAGSVKPEGFAGGTIPVG